MSITTRSGTAHSGKRLAATVALGAVLAAGFVGTASAQMGGTGPDSAAGSRLRQMTNDSQGPGKSTGPSAVPGATARTPAAPATKLATDLSPNDALFDAINRGDITAARDALNRGAELSAHNVLGMTPMELSVDLGRNDISFLLLSMRGEDSGRGSRLSESQQPAAADKPAKQAKAAPAPAPASAQNAKMVPVASPPVARAKLFANDGGAAVPNAGFLGFGSHGTN